MVNLQGEWNLKDLKKNKEWLLELNKSDQNEIIRATKHSLSLKKSVYKITKEDFPISSFQERINIIQNQIQGNFGFVVLKKLPVKEFNDEECKYMLWGLGQYLGFAEPQDKAGSLLHMITDTGKSVDNTDNIRGFQTSEELQFHTDGADIFALLCIRSAKEGGLSKLVSSVAIFREIEKTEPELCEILLNDFYFDTRAQNPNEKQIQKLPIFVKHGGLISGLHKRKYIETAQRFPEVPRLSEKQIEALDLVDKLCSSPEFCLQLKLEPGDLEIASNSTTFHSRENYIDYEDPSKKRLMLRLWLSLYNGRPLPKEYEETREWEPTFKRRRENQLNI
tara:strand:- start:11 stop:1015 length:1005 start_codon:yes stop_codon:yes gene_type:complete